MFRVVENPWYSTSLSKVCHYIDIHVLTWSVLRYSVYADCGKSMNLKLLRLEDPGKGLDPGKSQKDLVNGLREFYCVKTCTWLESASKKLFPFHLLHCKLAAVQCIVITPVCVFVCGSVTTITRNCVHWSSPNWVLNLVQFWLDVHHDNTNDWCCWQTQTCERAMVNAR